MRYVGGSRCEFEEILLYRTTLIYTPSLNTTRSLFVILDANFIAAHRAVLGLSVDRRAEVIRTNSAEPDPEQESDISSY